MSTKKLILTRRLADGNRDDADGACPFHTIEITSQGTEFLLVGIKLLFDRWRDFFGGVSIRRSDS
jgi:hypothetical protein